MRTPSNNVEKLGDGHWRMWGAPFPSKSEDAPACYYHVDHKLYTQLAGHKDPLALDIQEEADATHYGWLRADAVFPSLIWPHEQLFELCFPSGSAAAVARGEGRVVRLTITPWTPKL